MMLDAVIDLHACTYRYPSYQRCDPETGEEDERPSSDDEAPFSALAFKIMTDPFVGKLAFFSVYSGTLNCRFLCTECYKGKKERVGRILQMHANNREELKSLFR